jgi:hypothetical protein
MKTNKIDAVSNNHSVPLNITPEIFLGEQGKEIIKQLRKANPEFAEQFRKIMAIMIPHSFKDFNEEEYGFIRNEQLAAFINSTYYANRLLNGSQDVDSHGWSNL